MELGNRVALVTGAGRGIGKAVALAFAGNGADVAVAALEEDQVERTAEEIRQLGCRSLALATDLTKLSQVQRMVDRTVEEFGRIDILANVAGIWVPSSALELTEAQWDNTMNVNLKAAFFTAQHAARDMVKRKKGVIINVSSIGVDVTLPEEVDYCASKAGINSMTRGLTLEWRPLGVRVNAIAPGFTLTDLTREAWEGGAAEAFLPRIPAGRIGQPEDVAEVAVFLASDRSEYINGQVIDVTGGLGLML